MLIVFILANNSNTFAITFDKTTFWNMQQKGANIFNRNITREDIRAAQKYGIKFIRLAPDKMPGLQRDFLLGNADKYKGLVKEDLSKLVGILDICNQENMPVIITMLSLPGSRWKQNNNDIDDLRIWQNEQYQIQAAQFWQDLAKVIKNHPAIVGYNILNEPHPEKIFMSKEVSIDKSHHEKIQKILYNFYHRIIENIRLVDKDTAIILDSSAYADAKVSGLLIPQEDKNVIYSFHMYEPYEYTNYKTNKGKFKYPGRIGNKQWDKSALEEYLSSVTTLQKRWNIVNNRILVGEFGGHRKSPGLDKYFKDLLAIFDNQQWHYAFYAFREDTWDGMDYELGDQKLPYTYWQAIENNTKPQVKRQATHRAFSIIKEAINR